MQYEELVMEHSERVHKIKSADEQYLEETTLVERQDNWVLGEH